MILTKIAGPGAVKGGGKGESFVELLSPEPGEKDGDYVRKVKR